MAPFLSPTITNCNINPASTAAHQFEIQSSSKKRKWEEESTTLSNKLTTTSSSSSSQRGTLKSNFGIDLHLDTPLPFEWQRCLDINSGEIHFYNTRTHKRTSKDPTGIMSHMSLELQLNQPTNEDVAHYGTSKQNCSREADYGSRSNEKEEEEMVAKVCINCHILVMLCKSCPACPNCKFIHPIPRL